MRWKAKWSLIYHKKFVKQIEETAPIEENTTAMNTSDLGSSNMTENFSMTFSRQDSTD